MAYKDQTRGITNIFTDTPDVPTSGDSAQVIYKRAFDAFEHWLAQGWCERVALNWGSGGAGMDYFDGGSPTGNNSFFVYRFPPTVIRDFSFYVLMQYCVGATMGDSPGNPAQIIGNAGAAGGNLTVQFAVGASATGEDESPWNGTTDWNGSDTKGAVVWDVSGGPHSCLAAIQ